MVGKQRIIVPGEQIATEEEYSAGENTYVRDGKIISIALGTLNIDEVNKEASVKGKKVEQLAYGDIVTGKVNLVKESSAVIELLSAEGNKRITGINTAQLPIRNVSNEYVTELQKILKIGDIIRAKVVMSSPLAIDLNTKEKGLGVIKAYCSNCRKEMSFNNNQMVCLDCGSIEDRKWFEKVEEERQHEPREGGFRRDGPRDGGFRRDSPREGGFHRGGFHQNNGFRPNKFGNKQGFNRGNRQNFDQRNSF
jgi:exosome complex RNA-binding protein Csl4